MRVLIVLMAFIFSVSVYANDVLDDLWKAAVTDESVSALFDLQTAYTGKVISGRGYVTGINMFYSDNTADVTLSLYDSKAKIRKRFDLKLSIDDNFIEKVKALRDGDSVYFRGVFAGVSLDFNEIYVDDVQITRTTENIL